MGSRGLFLLFVVMVVVTACFGTASSGKGSSSEDASVSVSAPKVLLPKIIAEYPHDLQAYTQGLLFSDGDLYESTGEYGKSTLRRVDITTGRVEKSVALPERYFGEGLALIGDSLLYQLTWKEQRCFVYRKSDLKQVGMFSYSGEGWGLTPNEKGDLLYMSDGSSLIKVLDSKNFLKKREFQVRDDKGEVKYLNELEWIDGNLWANIYLTNKIAVIDPWSGYVTHYIDCRELEARIIPAPIPNDEVFNGIAYDSATRRIFVTGKNWGKLFEIEVDL